MRVEGFDFVNSCGGGGSGGGDFDFYQGFGEVFGVGVTGFIQRLGIGIDGEEVAAGGEAGEEGAEAALIFFDAFESRGS